MSLNPSSETGDLQRFTRAYPTITKDPAWLPVAAWTAVVLPLARVAYLHVLIVLLSLVLAIVATVLARRWFRRTYGFVTPTRPLPLLYRPAFGIPFWLTAIAIEWLSRWLGWPVHLGVLAFSALFAWSALASGGFRRHLLVLAAICAALAFLPLLIAEEWRQDVVFFAAFGTGWCIVCVMDYRVVTRNFAARGRPRHGG